MYCKNLARFLQHKRPDISPCKINVNCQNLARSYKLTVLDRLEWLSFEDSDRDLASLIVAESDII